MSIHSDQNRAYRAAILCVGTELTSGQIKNGNSTQLSQWLTDLGVEVLLHETVPDHRPLILGALSRCAELAQLIFVTGGLGPTTDDFTRDVIAEWTGQKLIFDPRALLHIQDRLNKVGIKSVESQRQQCFFPEGSRVLQNPEGTAHGFALLHQRSHVWVLPGPPVEIASIWGENKIEDEIRALMPNSRPKKLFSWQCLGRGEADLGEITERALQGSGLVTGYRFHRPYVEIKVWCEEENLKQAQPFIKKLENEIAPWIAARGDLDLAAELIQKIRDKGPIQIIDAATGGTLARRLGDLICANVQPLDIHMVTDWRIPISEPLNYLGLSLWISGISPTGEWSLGLKESVSGTELQKQETLKIPYRSFERTERNRAYLTEMALKIWNDWLEWR